MTGIPISTQQAIRIAVVFAALILGFGILSTITGWPDEKSWGLVVILALIIAVLPLLGPLLGYLRDSGAILEIRGVKLDFSASAVRGASARQVNFEDNPGMPVSDSNAASIAEAAEAAESAAFVVVDLGTGKSWYPTRLFALAAAAQELQGARAIVLSAQHGGIAGRFIGWIRPRDMVTAFCQSDQRYLQARKDARAVLQHLRLSGGHHTYQTAGEYQGDVNNTMRAYQETGDLAFVPALISRLQTPLANPAAVALASDVLENVSEPKWLSREEAERLLDPWMIREHISDGMPEANKLAMLAGTSRDFLAVTEKNDAYRGMIDVAATVRKAMLSSAGVVR